MIPIREALSAVRNTDKYPEKTKRGIDSALRSFVAHLEGGEPKDVEWIAKNAERLVKRIKNIKPSTRDVYVSQARMAAQICGVPMFTPHARTGLKRKVNTSPNYTTKAPATPKIPPVYAYSETEAEVLEEAPKEEPMKEPETPPSEPKRPKVVEIKESRPRSHTIGMTREDEAKRVMEAALDLPFSRKRLLQLAIALYEEHEIAVQLEADRASTP
jgi:hypothetical protein